MFSERVRDYLADIVENADLLTSYVEGMDADALSADDKTALAVERLFQCITEAVIQIGADEMGRIGSEVPIASIRSFGNRLRHDYRNIDPALLLQIAEDYLPALRDAAARALRE